MSARSRITPNPKCSPSNLAVVSDKLLQDLQAVREWLRNRIEGVLIIDPTTGSSQSSGVGNTDWNVNILPGLIVLDGTWLYVGPQVDVNVHTGSLYTGLSSGKSAIATCVAKKVTGTVSLDWVKGAAATTGSQVAPTDAEIQTALGAGIPWAKVAECLLNRTGDTTVTQSQNNAVRPVPGVTVDTNFGDWSAYA